MLHLIATDSMLVDGEITVDGGDTEINGTGGGSGGSIILESSHFSGK